MSFLDDRDCDFINEFVKRDGGKYLLNKISHIFMIIHGITCVSVAFEIFF